MLVRCWLRLGLRLYGLGLMVEGCLVIVDGCGLWLRLRVEGCLKV